MQTLFEEQHLPFTCPQQTASIMFADLAFSEHELEKMERAIGYNLSISKCICIRDMLLEDIQNDSWLNVEDTLMSLLQSNPSSSNLASLAKTDLGALVNSLHVLPLTIRSSFSVRLASVLVNVWKKSLKLAHEKERMEAYAAMSAPLSPTASPKVVRSA